MKIRYYLRGLGLGILVTAIFFMVSGRQSQTMSDEMIKARAKELGMSESVVLAEMATQEAETVPAAEEESDVIEEVPEETVAEEIVEEVISEEETAVTEVAEEAVTEESANEEESTEEAVSEEAVTEEKVSEEASEEVVAESENASQTASNSEPVVVTVNRGEGSDTVSRRLQELGLVADAHEYDRYLMANGYDKRIGAGEHSIPAGATWEDIAKILCNMK